MRRVRVIVSGRVQGVSFRAATAAEAKKLGVVGFAKNRSDGCVEIEAEGPKDRVTELLLWCEQGPPAARVTRFAVEELSPLGPGASERTFEAR